MAAILYRAESQLQFQRRFTSRRGELPLTLRQLQKAGCGRPGANAGAATALVASSHAVLPSAFTPPVPPPSSVYLQEPRVNQGPRLLDLPAPGAAEPIPQLLRRGREELLRGKQRRLMQDEVRDLQDGRCGDRAGRLPLQQCRAQRLSCVVPCVVVCSGSFTLPRPVPPPPFLCGACISRRSAATPGSLPEESAIIRSAGKLP